MNIAVKTAVIFLKKWFPFRSQPDARMPELQGKRNTKIDVNVCLKRHYSQFWLLSLIRLPERRTFHLSKLIFELRDSSQRDKINMKADNTITKENLIKRLRRIEGQVRGVQKMIEGRT